MAQVRPAGPSASHPQPVSDRGNPLPQSATPSPMPFDSLAPSRRPVRSPLLFVSGGGSPVTSAPGLRRLRRSQSHRCCQNRIWVCWFLCVFSCLFVCSLAFKQGGGVMTVLGENFGAEVRVAARNLHDTVSHMTRYPALARYVTQYPTTARYPSRCCALPWFLPLPPAQAPRGAGSGSHVACSHGRRGARWRSR